MSIIYIRNVPPQTCARVNVYTADVAMLLEFL